MRTHGSPLRVIATEYDTGDNVGDGFALRSAPPHICTSNAYGVPNTRSALICPPVGNLRFRFIPGIFGRMFLLWSAYLFCTDVACPTLLRSGPEVSLLGHADSASVHHTLSLSDSSRPLKSASGSSAISDSSRPLKSANGQSSQFSKSLLFSTAGLSQGQQQFHECLRVAAGYIERWHSASWPALLVQRCWLH